MRSLSCPRWRSRSYVSALVCLVGLASTPACTRHPASDGEAAGPRAPVPVRVRNVEPQSGQGGVRYSGTIEPSTRVDLAFKVGGYVRDVATTKEAASTRKLQEGDFVKQGTVLAVVRESDYQQKLSAAQAALGEALAAQKQAQLDYDRASKLLASSTVSKAEADTVNARLESANARVDGAKSHITEAQLALSDCTLRAPMDGVLLKRSVEVGTLVAPGSPAFVVADTRTVKVIFGAPDVVVEKLKPGSPLTVTLEAVPGDQSATITRIAPSADPKSRVFDVEATLDNSAGQLKVGMIASLKLPEAALASSSLVLPLTAVVRSPHDPRGFSVYLVENENGKDVARLRDVKLGDVVGNNVFVSEGLKNKDRVIAMGATLVADGDPVRVIP